MKFKQQDHIEELLSGNTRLKYLMSKTNRVFPLVATELPKTIFHNGANAGILYWFNEETRVISSYIVSAIPIHTRYEKEYGLTETRLAYLIKLNVVRLGSNAKHILNRLVDLIFEEHCENHYIIELNYE